LNQHILYYHNDALFVTFLLTNELDPRKLDIHNSHLAFMSLLPAWMYKLSQTNSTAGLAKKRADWGLAENIATRSYVMVHENLEGVGGNNIIISFKQLCGMI